MTRPAPQNFRSVPALLAFALTFAVGLGVDLWTKQAAFAALAPHGVRYNPEHGRHEISYGPDGRLEVQRVVPGWLHFQAMTNEGAVFGIGQGQRWLFVGVSVLAIGFILYLFATSGGPPVLPVRARDAAGRRDREHVRPADVRVRAGHDLRAAGKQWPGTGREVFPWIFNVADSLLCVGVGLIFVYTLRGAPSTRDRKDDEAAATKAEPAA
jgi:signal peptidase II